MGGYVLTQLFFLLPEYFVEELLVQQGQDLQLLYNGHVYYEGGYVTNCLVDYFADALGLHVDRLRH